MYSHWMAVAGLACSVSGCSAIGVVRPDPNTASKSECTTSPGLPVADTVGAVAFGGIGAASLACSGSASCSGKGHLFDMSGVVVGAGVVSLALSGILGASAAYGYVETGRCRTVTRRGLYVVPPEPSPAEQRPDTSAVLLPSLSPQQCGVMAFSDAPTRCRDATYLHGPRSALE
jgi:hypothetical protein